MDFTGKLRYHQFIMEIDPSIARPPSCPAPGDAPSGKRGLDPRDRRRLRRLLAFRIGIITVVLAMALAFGDEETFLPDNRVAAAPYLLIALAYGLTVVNLLLMKRIPSLAFHVYAQAVQDVFLITGFVFVTGGVRSVYSVFYPLVIIYSVVYLARRGGVVTASASSILYGLLVDLEYYGFSWLSGTIPWEYPLGPYQALYRVSVHVLSFYTIALLASFVVEQEKKARTLLQERESAFDQLDLLHRSIIQSVDAGILTVDLSGRIKSFNQAAENISGFTAGEVENRPLEEIFPGCRDLPAQANGAGPEEAHGRRGEITLRNRKGKVLALGCSISPLRDPQGNRIGDILIFHDLTALRRMERALEKNRRLALVGELAASLAHEIRNPLASISGSIQVLQNDLLLGDADRRLMQIILRGKHQIETFLQGFLLLARPAPGVAERLDLRDAVAEALESIRLVPDWREDQEVFLDLAGDCAIHANRTEMRQLFWNLILNALQAMPDRGALRIATRRRDRNGEALVEVEIRDEGVGIPPEHLDRLFEPFFTTKGKGTGLGLSVVQRILDNTGGTIRMDSAPGAGTACLLTFPAERS